MTRRIIALDLSLTATGFCEGERIEVWKTKLRGHERFQFVLGSVNFAVGDGLQPTVVLEGFSFGSKGSSLYEIAGLGYLVRHHLWLSGIPFGIVAPSTLKKYATGKGNAGKPDMLDAAIRRFGYQGTTDDNAVDAFLLWHLANEHFNTPVVKVPQPQAESAAKIEWEGAGR
jgi:Holliday junction resolvasome RuvABC endonuclease subunit